MKKLNKSKIDYLDYVFNPVTGCEHGCPYCWANKKFHRYKKDFSPQFHAARLAWPANTEKPGRVGVVYEGDLFGNWVPDEWIEKVFAACEAAPWHTYFFLTKNPKRYEEVGMSEARHFSYFGFSATDMNDYWDKYSSYNSTRFNHSAFVSYEPLQGQAVVGAFTDWLIVGAQTQPLKLPKVEWVLDIQKQCACLGIPIFMKNNLAPLGIELVQQWPEDL